MLDLGKIYIAEKPCKNFHDPCYRDAKTKQCLFCRREATRKCMKKLKENETDERKSLRSERMNEYIKEYNQDPEVIERRRFLERERYSKNKEKFKDKNRKYRKSNPEKIAYHAAKRRRDMKMSTPKWLSDEQNKEMLEFYILCRDCCVTTGEEYQVDHIIPIKGSNVCGLNVPWNLQILPKDLNISKKNSVEKGDHTWN